MEKKNINRRNFIGTGLAAAAAVTVGKSFATEGGIKPIPSNNKTEHPFNARTFNSMPTRSLGKTGYKVGI